MEPVSDAFRNQATIELASVILLAEKFTAAAAFAKRVEMYDFALVTNLVAMSLESYATVLRKYADHN